MEVLTPFALLFARRIARLAAIALLVLGSAGATDAPAVRILFIGNSLTNVNDLPSIVAAFAEASGKGSPVCRSIVGGGMSLQDHWDDGAAIRALEREKWDYVVLQQGPSASLEGRSLLLRYSLRFDPLIRRAGAKPALYMVWPPSGRRMDFTAVSGSYRAAASDIGAALLPPGEAWRIVENKWRGLKLYSSDGLHPTAAGSYLAAAVIFERLFGQSPIGLPVRVSLASGGSIELPQEDARRLQEAAAEANARNGFPAR